MISGRSTPSLKLRLAAICGVLAVLNLAGWLWAVTAFHDQPALLGIALVVYSLGLRHAVDADHIAAIDNVTRKLMQEGKRPVGVGFFFAMGHSAVVVLVAAAVAGVASHLDSIQQLKGIGGTISTSVSALFLLAIAAMNLLIFRSTYATYRRVKAGGGYVAEDLDLLLNDRGFLSRLFRPLFRLVTRSWHMAPLGLLFGLGFDTATEITMFGLAAAQAAQGVPLAAILVLPLLFAAGISLVDTLDSLLMLRVYDWAFVKPIRKLHYNMAITLVSALVALLIGGIEAIGLLGGKLGLSGGLWEGIGMLQDNASEIGCAIVGVFLGAWALSYLIYRAKGLDGLEAQAARRM